MGGLIPLGDASRRPTRIPIVTILIILMNSFVFVQELMGGDTFVMKWSAIPAEIFSGHHWITILTAMFMHASWSHIIGNMISYGPLPRRSKTRWAQGGILFSILSAGWWPCWLRSQPAPILRFQTWARAGRLPR